MTLDRSNLEYVLCSNPSFHRLQLKTQAILTNKILGALRKIGEVNGEDFLIRFRMKADRQLATADLERNPFGVWESIHKEVSFLVTKEMGNTTPIQNAVDDFLTRKEGRFA